MIGFIHHIHTRYSRVRLYFCHAKPFIELVHQLKIAAWWPFTSLDLLPICHETTQANFVCACSVKSVCFIVADVEIMSN